MMTRNEQIAFLAHEFLGSSDAILSLKDGNGDHWRIQMMARRCFRDDVQNMKEWGYLLFLHDGCSLVKKGGAA